MLLAHTDCGASQLHLCRGPDRQDHLFPQICNKKPCPDTKADVGTIRITKRRSCMKASCLPVKQLWLIPKTDSSMARKPPLQLQDRQIVRFAWPSIKKLLEQCLRSIFLSKRKVFQKSNHRKPQSDTFQKRQQTNSFRNYA